MDRAEVVAALREAYETGGMRLLAAIADDIREHGPIHDPEWSTCIDCGVEFEPHPNDTAAMRCSNCSSGGACRRHREQRANRRTE